MFDKHFIGQNAAGITAAPQFAPISKVVLLVDDERSYVAGNNTGREMELTCPYGSQAMANDLLTRLQGYAYRPMTAQDALLNPAAELGDGVTVGGVYTILAEMDTLFDMHCAADIAAPGEDEVDSEYKYQSPEKRLERQLATTRSLITKTAEEIGLKVEGLEGRYTALSVTLDGVTVTDEEGTTRIKGSSVETSTLKVTEANISGTLSASKVNLTGAITWGDLGTDVKNEINDAYAMAEDAEAAAADAANTVDAWRYNGGTYIDSSKIMVTTLMATELLGGEVALLTAAERQAGGLDITGSSSSTYAIELWSNGALRLVAEDGDLYMEAGGEYITIGYVSGEGYPIVVSNTLMPATDGNVNLGNYTYYWADAYISQCYGHTEAASTSDRNKKHDISYDLDRYDPFFDGLMPCIFKLNNGTSGRFHPGLIAQDVEQTLAECGIPTTDFAGFIKMEDSYALRYGEFIALLIWQVQKLKARVKELEVRL